MFNPIRRNRNIGRKGFGRGKDNKMVVPDDRIPVSNVDVQVVTVDGRSLTVIKQPLLPGFQYYVRTDEVAPLLERAGEDAAGIEFVIFRQPTKKREQLLPVWAAYWPKFEFRGRAGAAIIISAINASKTLKWPLSLTPEDERELHELKAEGRKVMKHDRYYGISMASEAIKRTQLGRSIPHEIGHHVAAASNIAHQNSEEFAVAYARKNKERYSMSGRNAGWRL
jgi:hypothetical protein